MKSPRVALVHDWLTGRRGGEKVLEVLSEIFPEAPIFTLIHFPGSQAESLERKKIRTSFIQKFPCVKKKYRLYLPFFPLAIELFDLQEYDLVISSSHCAAKGIIPRPGALHISYVHSPVRYAWNQYFSYFGPAKLGPFSRLFIPLVIHYLRIWDVTSSARVDYFIANSKAVAQRIEKYYRRKASVIHPPVDTNFFRPSENKGEYFLIVSALVPYKRIDLAVEVFNRNDLPLVIVGQGPELKKLKKRARKNIAFLGALSDEELLETYRKAKALLVPGEEDFGINSLEAQACGIPVIAYGQGGALETVVPGKSGLFFNSLSPESLEDAIDKFKQMQFNKFFLTEHAEKFSRERFKEQLEDFIMKKWTEFGQAS